MRYQKPIVMDLGAAARRAAGQDPLGCYDGSSPGAPSYWCQYGTSVTNPSSYGCTFGPEPGVGDDDCISGSSPTTTYCMVGAGGSNMGDTCTVGPSAAP